MSDPIPLLAAHPLVGVWRDADSTASSAEFRVRAEPSGFIVSGRDTSDGEAFEISEVHWDGETLSFVSRMPSTDATVEHEFQLDEDLGLVHRYTLTEKWVRVAK